MVMQFPQPDGTKRPGGVEGGSEVPSDALRRYPALSTPPPTPQQRTGRPAGDFSLGLASVLNGRNCRSHLRNNRTNVTRRDVLRSCGTNYAKV